MLLLGCLLGGCSTGHPRPIDRGSLAEAQAFPYYRTYWVGPRFEGHPLAAADGLKGYGTAIGVSVYYGDCVRGKGIFGGGSCILPLQVTTVIYRLHPNDPLGPQRNLILQGVPAVVYDEGRSIEIYTGRLAIDLFSDTFAHAVAAAGLLRPLNASGSDRGELPPPVYCPGLAGALDAPLRRVMRSLPGRICQRTRARSALAKRLY